MTLPGNSASADLTQWTNNRTRNPQKGGWVSPGAAVSETVFLVPTAKILDSASVQGAVRIYGNAVVSGESFIDCADSADGRGVNIFGNALVAGNASVRDLARVYGHAKVYENANVGGQVQVYEDSQIRGRAIVRDKAIISGNAIVGGDAIIGGDAVIRGYARIYSGVITNGVVDAPEPQEERMARLAREKAESEARAKKESLQRLFAKANENFPNIECADSSTEYKIKSIR